MTEGETFDVFNLYGLKMKSQATSLDGLPRGIYIVRQEDFEEVIILHKYHKFPMIVMDCRELISIEF